MPFMGCLDTSKSATIVGLQQCSYMEGGRCYFFLVHKSPWCVLMLLTFSTIYTVSTQFPNLRETCPCVYQILYRRLVDIRTVRFHQCKAYRRHVEVWRVSFYHCKACGKLVEVRRVHACRAPQSVYEACRGS